MKNVMLEILDGFLVGMSPDQTAFKVFKWMNISGRHSNSDFLTLLAFIAFNTNFAKKMSICRRWFIFGVSYYVNFQFTPWRVING